MPPNPELVEGAIDALEHVGPSHPLRAIVATPADGELRATVASSCWVGASDRQVCSERVLVAAGPRALPSAVTSLLVPDLPVFLWWQGPFDRSDGLAAELAGLASRVIVDSGECSLDGVAAARILARSVGGDLAWAGLLPWRDAVAGLFDGPSRGEGARRHARRRRARARERGPAHGRMAAVGARRRHRACAARAVRTTSSASR